MCQFLRPSGNPCIDVTGQCTKLARSRRTPHTHVHAHTQAHRRTGAHTHTQAHRRTGTHTHVLYTLIAIISISVRQLSKKERENVTMRLIQTNKKDRFQMFLINFKKVPYCRYLFQDLCLYFRKCVLVIPPDCRSSFVCLLHRKNYFLVYLLVSVE